MANLRGAWANAKSAYEEAKVSSIASNGLQVQQGDPVSFDANGNIVISTATSKIIGISATSKTYDSDNVTGVKDRVTYELLTEKTLQRVEFDADITPAMVGSLFAIAGPTDVRLSVASKSATAGQAQLVQVIGDRIGLVHPVNLL